MQTIRITKEVVDFVKCDICGEKINPPMYVVDEVEIRHKTGNLYPEGGSGEETQIDMCGKCFVEKLLPWIKSVGGEARTVEWDV